MIIVGKKLLRSRLFTKSEVGLRLLYTIKLILISPAIMQGVLVLCIIERQ